MLWRPSRVFFWGDFLNRLCATMADQNGCSPEDFRSLYRCWRYWLFLLLFSFSFKFSFFPFFTRNLPNWTLFSPEDEETASGPLEIVSLYFIICWPDCQYNLLFVVFYEPTVWMLGFHTKIISTDKSEFVSFCPFLLMFVSPFSLAKCKALSVPALCVCFYIRWSEFYFQKQ